jgi:hypothetical protein
MLTSSGVWRCVFCLQGLHVGIAVGVAMCALQFAYEYAKIQLKTLAVLPPLANVMMPQHVQQVLALLLGNLVAMSITGALSVWAYWWLAHLHCRVTYHHPGR